MRSLVLGCLLLTAPAIPAPASGGQLFEAKRAAQATACLSNLKQVAMAFLMFCTDNDDVFRMTASNYKGKLMPYCKNGKIFTCPLDKPGTTSYSFNPKLAGISASAVQDPSKTVLAYEGKAGKLSFRHDGKAAVAYVDGHVRRLDKVQAKSLRWKP
jgi:prepilin-type processing-associated H-X9-DG protein